MSEPDVATISNLLQTDGCHVCGARRFLFAVCALRGKTYRLCADCWRAAGQPPSVALGTAHELEEKIRKQMMARGAADLHMVRSGRT